MTIEIKMRPKSEVVAEVIKLAEERLGIQITLMTDNERVPTQDDLDKAPTTKLGRVHTIARPR